MIIDFAVRPPYKGFLSLVPSFRSGPPPKDSRHVSPWAYDCEPAPSKVQGSMDLFISEMDEAGISQAVVNHEGGRSDPRYGSVFAVSNDDIAELGELYPGRFHLFLKTCTRGPQRDPAAWANGGRALRARPSDGGGARLDSRRKYTGLAQPFA